MLRELPTPTIRADETLVRGRAAGVNPLDWKARDGFKAIEDVRTHAPAMSGPPPAIAGGQGRQPMPGRAPYASLVVTTVHSVPGLLVVMGCSIGAP